MSSRETSGLISCLIGSLPVTLFVVRSFPNLTRIGYLHPLIHLGFGIEFQQPAIIAEALGQTCIHSTWQDSIFIETERAVEEQKPHRKNFVDIWDSIRADQKLSTAARWEDDNKLRDGLLARASHKMIQYASHWQVDPSNLEEATAEIINGYG